jgi:AraC-like DNA-binding protein
MKSGWKWNWKNRKKRGFQRYLYKILLSNILLILIPISILGLFWYNMMAQQATHRFYQQKSVDLNEISSGINQRIRNIKLEMATEISEKRYSTYTYSGNYNEDLSMISKRLSAMTQKYSLLDSVYFYDRTTGNIYNSKTGQYSFSKFYDTKWMDHINENFCSIQQLPPRQIFDEGALFERYHFLYNKRNNFVLSLVLRGKPDFYLVTNISMKGLYNDVLDSYHLDGDEEEFFIADKEGTLMEGTSNNIDPKELMGQPFKTLDHQVSYLTRNQRIYFMKLVDFNAYSITSYPLGDSYLEAMYLGNYILLVCAGLILFSLLISAYMARRLYRPINILYSDFARGNKDANQDTVTDEIDMLKQIFSEMNTYNSNARIKLKRLDELSKVYHFRSFLENRKYKKDFINDHPYLFDENETCHCELLLVRFDVNHRKMTPDEELLFRTNLEEVLRSYLLSSQKGIITKIEEETFVLLYQGNEGESLEQTRRVLTDTVIKLTYQNAYFSLSEPIHNAEEIMEEFIKCQEVMKNTYFFQWQNQLVTSNQIEKTMNSDEIYRMLLNISASFIRSIVTQNQSEINGQFLELERRLEKIGNVSQVKDVYNRILVELDHEFHFTNQMETSLLDALYEYRTLADMIHYSRELITSISRQYKRNDAKEHNYCEMAKQYLNEHYMNDMNITDTADHLNISYSYLSKIFRSITGVTLTEYLNNIRIEKSKDYLTETLMTLTEISEKVGYNNVQSYQRFFKKYVTMTPGEYRKYKTPGLFM